MTHVCQKFCAVVYPALDRSPDPLVQEEEEEAEGEGGEEKERSLKTAN